MKTEFKGIGKIFSFSFKTMISAKGWKLVTILLAALVFLAPIVVFLISGLTADSSEPENLGYVRDFSGVLKNVYVSDETEGDVDYTVLKEKNEILNGIEYILCDTYDEAVSRMSSDMSSVILHITKNTDGYMADIITPDDIEDSEENDPFVNDVDLFTGFIVENFQLILLQKADISMEQLNIMFIPTEVEFVVLEAGEDDSEASESPEDIDEVGGINEGEVVKEILSVVLPYLTLMLLYFLVLFYGQSVARSLVLEKTSKLMDTFLVAVKPSALVFGKVFACVASAILQLSVWIISLIAGFLLGLKIYGILSPAEAAQVYDVIKKAEILKSVLSPSGIILSLLIILAGFLLYCALSAVGGSLAGKQEDLQSTNMLFSMILVFSFLSIMFNSGSLIQSGKITASGIFEWIPFTAVLITPSNILLGKISLLKSIGSLAVILVFSAVLMLIAGRLYKAMSLYKGNIPKPKQIISMIKNDK